MSRILELQPTDEQTIVARVLLELHQAIDQHFPNANESSRQFSKTVLSHRSEATAIDQQPNLPSPPQGNVPNSSLAPPPPILPRNPVAALTPKPQTKQPVSGLEFSKAGSDLSAIRATVMEEASWSKWLTRILVISFLVGLIALAWIYFFGAAF